MDSVNGIAGATMAPVMNKVKPAAEGNGGESAADDMKNIRKQRMQRKVLEDPSLAGKMVATQASPVYNAKGDLIQALSSTET
jgi:hypothetical protein